MQSKSISKIQINSVIRYKRKRARRKRRCERRKKKRKGESVKRESVTMKPVYKIKEDIGPKLFYWGAFSLYIIYVVFDISRGKV